jgi:hypothetical protein
MGEPARGGRRNKVVRTIRRALSEIMGAARADDATQLVRLADALRMAPEARAASWGR